MNRIVEFALKQRFFVLMMLIGTLAVGAFSFWRLNIEAYPDPVPPLVDIIAQSPGLSAEEMERYVTIPIEVQMAGIPHVTAIRTISLFGLTDVKLQFTYDFTYEQAEQWVINRLAQLPPLPNGVQPQISPSSPIGEIYRYRLVAPPGYPVADLKTLQDWVLQRRFKAIPGVIDVNGWGGKTKTYEVAVDAHKMTEHGVTVPQVLAAIGNANINVGGQTVDIGPQAAVVRGVGQIHSVDDIARTAVATVRGVPILVSDVAAVSIGNEPRLGIAGHDGDDDIVEGIVLMRRGAQSMPTIEKVNAEVERINGSNVLPPGVRLERIYDRADLIHLTTHTVLHNMVVGIGLIFLLQWLFLGNLRSAFIVAMTIPFALSFAIALMVAMGESANLLSVGAIDFGLVVDASVIMVENIFRHLNQRGATKQDERPGLHRLRTTMGLQGKFALIANSATEVNKAILFSAAIIIAGFVPLFTMAGIEGHIFGPMAKTYAYAITGGLIATFTISPALSSLLLKVGSGHGEEETWIDRSLRRIYAPVVEFALAHRRRTFLAVGVLLVLAVLAARGLGLEFLPKLEEGNLWIRATMPASVSLSEGDAPVNGMRRIIGSFPEVETVVSQHGRPDDGTDATGFFNAEFFVPLKPADRWPKGEDKEALTQRMTKALSDAYPGVEFNFSQYIQDNVEEAASGVKGENSIKLYGPDLVTLERTADQIKTVLAGVPGVTDLAVLQSLGQPTVKIDIDRERAGRYGLAPGDINATVQAAIGGQSPGDLYEPSSDRHFPIVVRLGPEYRGSLEAISRIQLGAQGPNGPIQVPLSEVAHVQLVSGASFIYREQQERYIPIKFSVRGRDLGSAVLEAEQKVNEAVALPPGYRLEWVGEFGNLQEALARLGVVVPISIVLICLLLYINFGSIVDVLLAASVIPMALIGGIFALYLTGTAFSVSAAIGFVALFGIAAMDGIIVLSYYNQNLDLGMSRAEAIRRTCEVQMRPVVMTCVVACVGLVPAALSTGIGSQVQKPLALVVVGGILLAPILILVVLPVLIDAFSPRGRSTDAATPPAEAP